MIPSCSDQTSNSLISVHQCHPWIGNADTHSTWRIYNRVAITHLLHQVSPERGVFIRLCKLVPWVRHPIEWKMERSQKWVEKSDLWLILVVVSYIQRVLWYHLVAIRPQTAKSLCISVIPGSVMLTHTILEGFIIEWQSHTYSIECLKRELITINMA